MSAAGGEHRFAGPDGLTVVYDVYLPAELPTVVVQVAHGWGEHAGRYRRLAAALTGAGCAVVGGHGVLDSVRAVTTRVAADFPDLPLLLLGHSWGSFLAQEYVRRWSDALAGLVLTGTTYRVPGTPRAAVDLNAPFEPTRPAYDWLTRDPDEVDAYLADPCCGLEVVSGAGIVRPAAQAEGSIRPDLPVLILNGSDDPVGGAAGGAALAQHYRELGAADVELRVYAGGRHEVFNETNRDEITADLLAWLGKVLP